MGRLQIISTSLLTQLLFISCTDENPAGTDEQSQRGTISGTVTTGSSTKLSGVSVTLDIAGHTTTTDTSRLYTIPDVPTGDYSITFTKTNYFDTTPAENKGVLSNTSTDISFQTSPKAIHDSHLKKQKLLSVIISALPIFARSRFNTHSLQS